MERVWSRALAPTGQAESAVLLSSMGSIAVQGWTKDCVLQAEAEGSTVKMLVHETTCTDVQVLRRVRRGSLPQAVGIVFHSLEVSVAVAAFGNTSDVVPTRPAEGLISCYLYVGTITA